MPARRAAETVIGVASFAVRTKLRLYLLAGALVAALAVAAVVLVMAVVLMGAAGTDQCGTGAGGSSGSASGLSAEGQAAVPGTLIPIYQAAAAKYGLGEDGWIWLAAFNKEETDFGRNLNYSSVGAEGWMQFMPDTWATYGVDGDGDGDKDPWDATDGIFGAANYLHALGAPADWASAAFKYNHAGWYVDQVTALHDKYKGGGTMAVSAAILEGGAAQVPGDSGAAGAAPAAGDCGCPGSQAAPVGPAGGELMVVGDSLGVGAAPFLEDALGSSWTVSSDVRTSRTTAAGIAVLRAGRPSGTLLVQLGTNDTGESAKAFEAQVDTVLKLAGDHEVFWVNLAAGPGGERLNKVLAAKASSQLHVIDWAGAVASGQVKLTGVHADTAGYEVRAQLIATALNGAGGSSGAPNPAGAPASGGGAPDQAAATSYAQGREGNVAFAVADPTGHLLASFHGADRFHSASITKAMLLVASTRKHVGESWSPAQSSDVAHMIRDSDNQAANRVLSDVGTAAVQDVARAAGMTSFKLDTSDPNYHLGNSLITAADQARLFARIDQLMSERHRSEGLDFLSSLTPGKGTWGILDAGLTGRVYSKSGWRTQEGEGNTENQGAQLTGSAGTVGLAVLSDHDPSPAYGHETQTGVTTALKLQAGGTAAGGCDTGTEGLQLTPGEMAKLLPDGTAAAPESAPEAVKAMIAAGNRIVGKPYGHFGESGTHGTPYTTVQDVYDCSSSVAFLLFGGGFITSPTQNWTSGPLGSSFGMPGPGKWVEIRGNADHVFMYVAGLRWDTHRMGAGDQGNAGIGWHTARRDPSGFPARHPEGT